MLPARFEQASFSLVEINNAKFTHPAVSSGMSVGSFPEQRLVIGPRGSAYSQIFLPKKLLLVLQELQLNVYSAISRAIINKHKLLCVRKSLLLVINFYLSGGS